MFYTDLKMPLEKAQVLLTVTIAVTIVSFMVLIALKQSLVFSDRTGVPSWSMTMSDSDLFNILCSVLFVTFAIITQFILVRYIKNDKKYADLKLDYPDGHPQINNIKWWDNATIFFTMFQIILFVCVIDVVLGTYEMAHLGLAGTLFCICVLREFSAWWSRYCLICLYDNSKDKKDKFTKAAGCTPYEYRTMLYVNLFVFVCFLILPLLVYVGVSIVDGTYSAYTTAIVTAEILGIMTILFLREFDVYSYYSIPPAIKGF
jgi:hypothetical protein